MKEIDGTLCTRCGLEDGASMRLSKPSSLRKSPAFAAPAIVSLALGIGVNTAIFAIAKKVLFDALPVKESEQMRLFTWVSGKVRPVPPVGEI